MEPADLVTWTTLLGFAIALFGYLATMKRDLRRDLGAMMDARFARAEAATAARFAQAEAATAARFAEAEAANAARFAQAEAATAARFAEAEAANAARFAGVDAWSDSWEKSMNTQFAAIGQRIDDVNTRLDDLNTRVGEVREELRTSNAAMRAELSMVEQRTFELGLNQQPRAG